MSYAATVYQVMIASPGDMEEEREIIREVIFEWNNLHSKEKNVVLLPVGWETHSTPEMGDRPQAIINKRVLKDCDLLVGVFSNKLGTPTGKSISGTVEEIEEHEKSAKPVMLYFSTQDVSRNADRVQLEQLEKYKKECSSRGLYEIFKSSGNFKEKFSMQLTRKIIENEYFEVEEDADSSDNQLLPEFEQIILKLAADSYKGTINKIHSGQGFIIRVNKKDFKIKGTLRNKAKYDGALKNLENNGLIRELGYSGSAYVITQHGCEFVEKFLTA